jgi:LacI family transcriptional regulator
VPIDNSLISSDAMTEENGYRKTRALLSREDRPTAIICSRILLASGAIRAVHEAGLRIGKEISLIAHDDGLPFLRAEGLSPPLTTTRSSIRAAGSRIAELLLQMIVSPSLELPHELWNAELIVRGSTGPVLAS